MYVYLQGLVASPGEQGHTKVNFRRGHRHQHKVTSRAWPSASLATTRTLTPATTRSSTRMDWLATLVQHSVVTGCDQLWENTLNKGAEGVTATQAPT